MIFRQLLLFRLSFRLSIKLLSILISSLVDKGLAHSVILTSLLPSREGPRREISLFILDKFIRTWGGLCKEPIKKWTSIELTISNVAMVSVDSPDSSDACQVHVMLFDGFMFYLLKCLLLSKSLWLWYPFHKNGHGWSAGLTPFVSWLIHMRSRLNSMGLSMYQQSKWRSCLWFLLLPAA